MNQDNDKPEAREVDPQVSAHYEKLADEKTPANLDQAVLREAARAMRADNRKGSFGAWFRPVAFMATVGLSLAIILDLSDTSILSPLADWSIDAAPPAPTLAPTETAVDAAQKNRAQSTVSEMKRQKRSVSAQSLTVDAPDISSDGFTTEVERAEQRAQEMEANSGPGLQSEPATAAQFTESQAAFATRPLSMMMPLVCSDEQKSGVDEWWECVETLRQSGLDEAADSELESLRETFPDFEPPE